MNDSILAGPGSGQGLRRRLGLMSLSIVLLAGIALGVTLNGRSTGVASAAINPDFTMSLTIPGISGDGTSSSSTNIAVHAYSFGLSRTIVAASAGTTTGKPKFDTFSIQKSVDTASPLLMEALANGTNLGTVIARINMPGAEADSAVVTMSRTRVSAINDSGAPGGGSDESVSFVFQKITFDYVSIVTLKRTHFGWDLATNRPA